MLDFPTGVDAYAFLTAEAAGGGVMAAAFTACYVVVFAAFVVAGGCVTAGMAGLAEGCLPPFGAFASSSFMLLKLRLVLIRAVVCQLVGNWSGCISLVTGKARRRG